LTLTPLINPIQSRAAASAAVGQPGEIL